MENTLFFDKNGRIRILQVTDPQDLKFVRKAMVEMLDEAYDRLKPDAVLFTGDNILGNHLLDARFGSRQVASGKEATLKVMKEALSYILAPVEKRRIPFAMVYGNHDDMNPVSKEEQIEIYRSYSMCMDMNKAEPSVDCDTYVIECKNPDGKTVFCVYMLDCAWQDMDGERKCHTDVKPETVEWYKNTSEALRNANGGKPVPSIMMLHIPLPATLELLEECNPDEFGAIKSRNGGYCRLDPLKAHGYMGEYPAVLNDDNGLYDAILACGDVKAIVTGHDHVNCFEGTLNGIKFIQTGCASFRCYGNKSTRGVRVFDIYENGSFETKFYSYEDLCGNSPYAKARFFMDSDENEKKKFALIGFTAASAVVGTAAKLIKKLIK